jgi:hypothetical protein
MTVVANQASQIVGDQAIHQRLELCGQVHYPVENPFHPDLAQTVCKFFQDMHK